MPEPVASEPVRTQTAPVAMPEPVHAEPLPPVAAEPTPVTPVAAPALVPGFYINVGLFAVPGNASNAIRKLETAGLPVFSEALVTSKGALTRVRVGPFATKAKAQAAAKKIHALKLDAVVFRH